jgi:hypothetical protein
MLYLRQCDSGTLEVEEEEVITLEFSHNGSYLDTNLGVTFLCLYPPHATPDISIEHEEWINVNGKRALWLPIESRPIFSGLTVIYLP